MSLQVEEALQETISSYMHKHSYKVLELNLMVLIYLILVTNSTPLNIQSPIYKNSCPFLVPSVFMTRITRITFIAFIHKTHQMPRLCDLTSVQIFSQVPTHHMWVHTTWCCFQHLLYILTCEQIYCKACLKCECTPQHRIFCLPRGKREGLE